MALRLIQGIRRNPDAGLRRKLALAALLGLLLSAAASAADPADSPGKAGGKASRTPTDHAGEPPALEGRLQARRLLNVTPEWRTGFQEYQPDGASVEMIRSFSRSLKGDLQLEVVVGTWCSDSRREVPRFIKIQRSLKKDRLPVTFWGVDRSKTKPPESVEGRTIEKVPTFIVKYRGQEIGRIIETPTVSMEADLAEILSTAGKS